MPEGRIVIIPFLHGKHGPDGDVREPDIDAILACWLNSGDTIPDYGQIERELVISGHGKICEAGCSWYAALKGGTTAWSPSRLCWRWWGIGKPS